LNVVTTSDILMTVRDAFVDVVLQTTSYELELELLDDRDRLKTS